MKSRSEIWLSALDEFGALCSVNTARDSQTVMSRVAQEGDSFFTVTLPSFAKSLERSLAEGGIPNVELVDGVRTPDQVFEGFSRRTLHVIVRADHGGRKTKKYSRCGVPEFLGGFLDLVFDSTIELPEWWYLNIKTEVLPPAFMRVVDAGDEPEIARMATAIWAVRQLCLMFAKEKELCSDDLIERAINNYSAHDETLMRPLWTIERAPSFRDARSWMSEGSWI